LPQSSRPKKSFHRGSSEEHKKLRNDILVALSKIHGVKVWPQETGVAKTLDDERHVRYGLRGSADISGLMIPYGTRLEVECKTGNAVQSKQQVNFMNMIIECGGLYIVARSVLDATDAVSSRMAQLAKPSHPKPNP
jgi:hypothetical protein